MPAIQGRDEDDVTRLAPSLARSLQGSTAAASDKCTSAAFAFPAYSHRTQSQMIFMMPECARSQEEEEEGEKRGVVKRETQKMASAASSPSAANIKQLKRGNGRGRGRTDGQLYPAVISRDLLVSLTSPNRTKYIGR